MVLSFFDTFRYWHFLVSNLSNLEVQSLQFCIFDPIISNLVFLHSIVFFLILSGIDIPNIKPIQSWVPISSILYLWFNNLQSWYFYIVLFFLILLDIGIKPIPPPYSLILYPILVCFLLFWQLIIWRFMPPKKFKHHSWTSKEEEVISKALREGLMPNQI